MRRLVLVFVLAVAACSGGEPQLRFDDAVPGDLRELAASTWDDLLAALPARHGCIADVDLVSSRELDAPAAYRADEGLILIRIPRTAGQLEQSLVHEFAHHVEATCAAHAELRPAFLAAQRFPPDAGWFDATTWETTPSEHFAEATVEAVLGRRIRNRDVLITDDAVEVVEAWGRGR